MLCLSRKIGEKLVIAENIILTINRISGDRVSIGIEAPREVLVSRGELLSNPPVIAPISPLIEPTDIPGQFRYVEE